LRILRLRKVSGEIWTMKAIALLLLAAALSSCDDKPTKKEVRDMEGARREALQAAQAKETRELLAATDAWLAREEREDRRIEAREIAEKQKEAKEWEEYNARRQEYNREQKARADELESYRRHQEVIKTLKERDSLR
jgi:hypothetical protein